MPPRRKPAEPELEYFSIRVRDGKLGSIWFGPFSIEDIPELSNPEEFAAELAAQIAHDGLEETVRSLRSEEILTIDLCGDQNGTVHITELQL